MIAAPRVGLLPLYLKLYDETLPALRAELEPFRAAVAAALEAAGMAVVAAPICCVRAEFEAAVARLAGSDIDLIVTLHLAYSPSLESADALAASDLPILMLDTTPDAAFGRDVDPGRLLYNHGIHGLQDLAAMLRRRGKAYFVVAGHLADPALLARAGEIARAARAARRLRSSRVLRIGRPFEGMGDFQVDERVLLEKLGIAVETISAGDLAAAVASVTDAEIAGEVSRDGAAFRIDCAAAVHRRSARLGLGLRRHLERGSFTSLTMNFLAFDDPASTVPFLECSKAMARGLGYAGEGDALTAALVGAINQGFEPATFTEIFCPDWSGGALFLSHMGEFNPAIAAATPRLFEKPWPFTRALPPACLACAPRRGPATLINLAPGPDDTFRLIVAPVTVLEDGTHPAIADWIRAWIRPAVPLPAFLETYSRLGGTHHSALMPGDRRAGLEAFAAMAGLEHRAIEAEIHG